MIHDKSILASECMLTKISGLKVTETLASVSRDSIAIKDTKFLRIYEANIVY